MTSFNLFTALITPFKNNQIDETAFTALIEQQKAAGIEALVVGGSTGEGPSLTAQEKKQLLGLALKAKSHVTIVAAVGSPSTEATLEQCRQAYDLGADIGLVITPYALRPTQEGLFQHFAHLATKSPLPLILYNIPSRTNSLLEIETLLRLISFPSIIGLKESNPSFTTVIDTLYQLKKERPDFLYFAGDDLLAYSFLQLGADGLISVASNLLPEAMIDFVSGSKEGQREMAYQFYPLFKALVLETNPIMIKAAMHLVGKCSQELRLPLTNAKAENLQLLAEVLQKIGMGYAAQT